MDSVHTERRWKDSGMSVKTTVTLPEEVVQLLDAYAAERGCLRKDIIIEAIKEYLEPLYSYEEEQK